MTWSDLILILVLVASGAGVGFVCYRAGEDVARRDYRDTVAVLRLRLRRAEDEVARLRGVKW